MSAAVVVVDPITAALEAKLTANKKQPKPSVNFTLSQDKEEVSFTAPIDEILLNMGPSSSGSTQGVTGKLSDVVEREINGKKHRIRLTMNAWIKTEVLE